MVQLIHAVFGLLFSLFESIVSGISDIIVSSVKGNRKEQYNADFMPADKILSSKQTGFCLTGILSLSKHDSCSNCIGFASSGGGKSSCILIPSILKMTDSSLIVNDPSTELLVKTATAKIQQGFVVKVLNYTNPKQSERFNPLYRVKTISDIKKISKLLVLTSLGGTSKDKFWDLAAENLLTIFIRYIIFYTNPAEHTLHKVLLLLETFSGSPQKIDALFVATDTELLTSYKSLVGTDSKMLSSIVATAKTSLSIFSDPEVAEVTSEDTIDFESFRDSKIRTILFINNNVQDLRYYGVITSLLFEQFFGSIMRTLPKPGDRYVYFLIDEASSLYLHILPVAISNIRKYSSGLLLLFQSQHQLMELYGISAGRNILANCFARVYFPNQPPEVCRELELLAGKYEIITEDDTRKIRPLISMDEIRILKNEALILCGNSPLIKVKLSPFYEQRTLLAQTQLVTYQVPDILSNSLQSDENTNDKEKA